MTNLRIFPSKRYHPPLFNCCRLWKNSVLTMFLSVSLWASATMFYSSSFWFRSKSFVKIGLHSIWSFSRSAVKLCYPAISSTSEWVLFQNGKSLVTDLAKSTNAHRSIVATDRWINSARRILTIRSVNCQHFNSVIGSSLLHRSSRQVEAFSLTEMFVVLFDDRSLWNGDDSTDSWRRWSSLECFVSSCSARLIQSVVSIYQPRASQLILSIVALFSLLNHIVRRERRFDHFTVRPRLPYRGWGSLVLGIHRHFQNDAILVSTQSFRYPNRDARRSGIMTPLILFSKNNSFSKKLHCMFWKLKNQWKKSFSFVGSLAANMHEPSIRFQ